MVSDDDAIQKCNEMNITKIPDPVYETNIWCIWNCDNDEFYDWVTKKYGVEITRIGCQGRAILIQSDVYSHFIIYLSKANYEIEFFALLNHELIHLVQYIMDYVQMPFNDDTNEAYAYFSSYLTRKILNKVLKKVSV